MRHHRPMSTATIAYTDGACSGNPGPGGWAWAVPGGRFASGAAAHTTNQRMEITAAHEALKALPGRLDVVSDSTYVVHCFRDRWHEAWVKRGWKNSKREPVANRDLWEPFVEEVLARGDVTFRWVKGHSGDPMNDLVDALAVEASLTQEGRDGTGEPELPAPVAAAPTGRDRRLPAGRLVLVTGLRPEQLGGYDANRLGDGVRSKLADTLAAMVTVDGPLSVVSGMGLGAEQLGAEAALGLDLPLVAVLPYPEADSAWPGEARARFKGIVEAAAVTVTLDRKVPATRQLAGAALGRRDAWLANQVDEAVVVWDQEDEVVGRTVRSLEDHLGPEQVLLVHP